MNELQIIKEWRERHNVYVTLDRNQMDTNKIIFTRGNNTKMWKIEGIITEEYLNKLFEEFDK